MKHLLISTAFFAALANPAAAYTAFLLPQAFWPAGASVTVDAGYAQQFFAPQIAIGGTYQVIGPTADAGIISGMEIGANATHLTLQGMPGGFDVDGAADADSGGCDGNCGVVEAGVGGAGGSAAVRGIAEHGAA